MNLTDVWSYVAILAGLDKLIFVTITLTSHATASHTDTASVTVEMSHAYSVINISTDRPDTCMVITNTRYH